MNQSRLFLIGALVIAAAALAFVASGGIGENLVYFWEPIQLRQAGDDAVGPQIRLGGVVKEGTLVFDEEAQTIELVVKDENAEVPIRATGAPPAMLRENIGVVVEGRMGADGVFVSDRLMVKHSNEYKAPEEDMTPEERQTLYETMDQL